MRLRQAAQALLPHFRKYVPRWLSSRIPRRMRHWLWARYSPNATLPGSPGAKSTKDLFVPEFDGGPPPDCGVRLIAFYLPQFHPILENDRWWGEGFTEWDNVRQAAPQFHGHYQPRVPIDMGYYDLRDPLVLHRQVELARRYGIGGFCFYFYWFGGRRLLETPLLNYLNDTSIDFPFCLCWANENWTRRWDGRERDLLVGQKHSAADDLEFIDHVSRYFADPRYIRMDNRPLLLVYRPALLPDAAATVERWRDRCRKNGVGEPYVAMVQSFQGIDPEPYGMDAAVEFPWHTGTPTDITIRTVPAKSDFRGFVFDWEDYAERGGEPPDQPWTLMRGVMPGWDNTPRRKRRAHLFHGHSPEVYGHWLKRGLRWTLAENRPRDERLLFINAWNEWGEGAYLEPDERFGYAFLQATREAVREVAEHPVRRATAHPIHDGFSMGEAALVSKQVAPADANLAVSATDIDLRGPDAPKFQSWCRCTATAS